MIDVIDPDILTILETGIVLVFQILATQIHISLNFMVAKNNVESFFFFYSNDDCLDSWPQGDARFSSPSLTSDGTIFLIVIICCCYCCSSIVVVYIISSLFSWTHTMFDGWRSTTSILQLYRRRRKHLQWFRPEFTILGDIVHR